MADQDLKIAIGNDHRGYKLKKDIIDWFKATGINVIDCGTDSEESTDYPDYGIPVAEKVASAECKFGILLCYTGIGMSMTAGKVRGIRAALCRTVEDAHYARAHNNANVLVLAARDNNFDSFKEIWQEWFKTDFEGGRHKRRIDKISAYEDRTTRC